jgi:predicted nucleotide-binding protein with TIR-like domain
MSSTPTDPRVIFVIHGRDERLRKAMFDFLRALGLKPLEWSEAVSLTGVASPYVGQVLDVAFAHAQAVVVLMTPDDEVRLREDLQRKEDAHHERELTGQARPNVLFEAGMALARHPERTLFIEVGKLRPFSDIGGRHVIRLDNSFPNRQEVATRLRTAGCSVNTTGTDWHTTGDFTPPSPKVADVFDALRQPQSCRALAMALSARSKEGVAWDPQVAWEEALEVVRPLPGVIDPEKELNLVVYELEQADLVKTAADANSPFGWHMLGPTGDFFWKTDTAFQSWNPKDDARELCNRAEAQDNGFAVQNLAQNLGWEPRRLNAALAFMVAHGLVEAPEVYAPPYLFPWGHFTHEGQLFREKKA